MRHPIVFALLAVPALLSAQSTAATVSPGMTRAQVVAALGEPATARTANEHTYLFYQNSCGRHCGMNDLVILQGDSVVDAIFRSPNRHYTGTSSSPSEATPLTAASRRRAAKAGTTAPTKTATASAKPAATTPAAAKAPTSDTVATAKKPAVATSGTKKVVTVPGTKREVTVPGTKSEVTVPGTKTETTTPVKMVPNAPNDTRPSIPVNPPLVNPAPATPPAPEKTPAT